jgi:predicted nucleic acid-binding protein
LPVLACAAAAKADAIVTGDKDLLVLKSFRGIPIMTVREVLGRLKTAP